MIHHASSRTLLLLFLCIIPGRLIAQDSVDATTLYGKYMCGYQGWFRANGDGANQGWVHWFSSKTDPSAAKVRVDLFPDLREHDADELFSTNLRYGDGSTVKLFSSHNEKTVVRHFKWMKDNDIDGAWIQRFTTPHIGLTDPTNVVLMHCRKGAEIHGRVFVVMYDISNNNASTLVQDIKNDWMHLVDVIKVTESPRYLWHKGKPLVSIWGFGCDGRPGTPAEAAELVNWFQRDAPAKYRATFMGGVNGSFGSTHWSDQPEPWASVFRSMDVISPWTVGRYSDSTGADNWKESRMIPDMAVAAAAGKDYLPVIWPGFSWHNMKGAAENQTPRRGGRFYWRQAYNAVDIGATMLYGAMFDEVDEATAIFKASPRRSMAPTDPYWLTLDADGYDLPSDWYLQLSGLAKKMLNGQIPLSKTMPLVPPPIIGGTRYEIQTYILGEGQVQIEPLEATYASGTEVRVTAVPNSNWAFHDWLGDLNSRQVSDRVIMNANKSVLVTFYPSGNQVLDVRATKDSYVRGGSYASTNYGMSSSLIIKEDPSAPDQSYRTYLQFDLHSLAPSRPEAILVLRSNLSASSSISPARVDLFASSSDAWTETSVTWQNAPAVGSVLGSNSSILYKDASYLWDVSDAVSSEIAKDSIVSFVLKDQGGLARTASFYPRENTFGYGPFLRLITPATSSVPSQEPGVPLGSELKRNYPNPFNPTTTIEYHIAAAALVTMKVFDSLGREVATLVNGGEEAGYHAVTFDASHLASGMYFARFIVQEQSGPAIVQTAKLLLAK
jgi:hypothetical protein